MDSWYQEAAWDCFQGVCDQGQCHCYKKIEIQFLLNNYLEFALAYWHQTSWIGSLYQEAAWDCYPGVCDQG
jgi:hypothetical protein